LFGAETAESSDRGARRFSRPGVGVDETAAYPIEKEWFPQPEGAREKGSLMTSDFLPARLIPAAEEKSRRWDLQTASGKPDTRYSSYFGENVKTEMTEKSMVSGVRRGVDPRNSKGGTID
jgi:hypothetical protein